MRLTWTRGIIPHGYLCDTPVHLIYRVRGCGCVAELRRLADEAAQQYKLLRKLGTMPPAELQSLITERMEAYDALLDAQDQSKFPLAQPAFARTILDSWMTLREREECRLYAVCVMGNHVHALLAGSRGAGEIPIGSLVKRHKTFTDRELRSLHEGNASFWDPNFYDRYVRPGRFDIVLKYILQNPVKAGLVKDWRDWTGTWVDKRCLGRV